MATQKNPGVFHRPKKMPFGQNVRPRKILRTPPPPVIKICEWGPWAFTVKVIKSHVKLSVKSNATKIPREISYLTPYTYLTNILPYTLHYTFHSTIVNFSACCNTSRGIKLAASRADRLRSACSLVIIYL